MMIENGRVVAIERDSLWVETIARSTCGSCQAEAGCGQGVLARWMSRSNLIRVLLDGRDPASFQVNDQIDVGVPEDVIVKGSLFVYLLPLAGLLAGAGFGQAGGDAVAALSGLAGFLVGGLVVALHAMKNRNNRRVQPVIWDDRQILAFKSR